MSAKTVKVTNVSLGATQRDIKEFFSFSGDIEYIELKSCDDQSQIAYVTFKGYQGAETALLLSGATICDSCVLISLDQDYHLPPTALSPSPNEVNKSRFRKAEDIVSSMLAKGFILGKDAIGKAKAFDEKHRISSTVSSKVISLDEKIGLSHKISMGTSMVNGKAREVDHKLQVSQKTKSVLCAAEQKVSGAMNNRFVLSGCSLVSNAFGNVARVAEDVGQKTKEKVEKAEEEQKRKMVDEFAELHLPESPKASSLSSREPSDPSATE